MIRDHLKETKLYKTQTHAEIKQVTEEIKEEIKKYLKPNGNEKMTTPNLCDAITAMRRSNFIAIQEAYHKTWKQHQLENLILHLNNLEKEEKLS